MLPYHNFVTVENDRTISRVFEKDGKGNFTITIFILDSADDLVSQETVLTSSDFVIACSAFIQLIEDSL